MERKGKHNKLDSGLSALSFTVAQILLMVDMLDEGDLRALERARKELDENIGYNQAVSIVAVACGGKMYDADIDRMKSEELRAIIALAEARGALRRHASRLASVPDGNGFHR